MIALPGTSRRRGSSRAPFVALLDNGNRMLQQACAAVLKTDIVCPPTPTSEVDLAWGGPTHPQLPSRPPANKVVLCPFPLPHRVIRPRAFGLSVGAAVAVSTTATATSGDSSPHAALVAVDHVPPNAGVAFHDPGPCRERGADHFRLDALALWRDPRTLERDRRVSSMATINGIHLVTSCDAALELGAAIAFDLRASEGVHGRAQRLRIGFTPDAPSPRQRAAPSLTRTRRAARWSSPIGAVECRTSSQGRIHRIETLTAMAADCNRRAVELVAVRKRAGAWPRGRLSISTCSPPIEVCGKGER